MATIRCCMCDKEFKYSESQKRKFCSKECYAQNRTGKKAWNKGLHGWQTPEHTETIRLLRVKWNKEHPRTGELNAYFGKVPPCVKYGPEHRHWKGGRKKTSSGYIYKLAKDHPRQHNGYVFEHILVMEEYLGRYLEQGEVVHHCDHNRSNNDLNNLELMLDSEHKKLNWDGRRNKFKMDCLVCGKEFETHPNRTTAKYCSRHCKYESQRGKPPHYLRKPPQ